MVLVVWDYSPVTIGAVPLAPGQPQAFFIRRWRYPKPYMQFTVTSDNTEQCRCVAAVWCFNEGLSLLTLGSRVRAWHWVLAVHLQQRTLHVGQW